jgi:hypothetical protein
VSKVISYHCYTSLYPLVFMSCPSVFHNIGFLSCISSLVATIWQFPITSLHYNCMRVARLNDGQLFGQSQPHVPTQSQEQYKISKKRTTNFCSLKKRTLQLFLIKKAHSTNFVTKKANTTNFSNQKSAHYNFVIKKAHTTDFCSPKKRTLQTFSNQKSAHYKLL